MGMEQTGTWPSVRSATLALAIGALLAAPAGAAEWDFAPRVSLSQSWVDNVTLAPSGQEESEWITALGPGFGLEGKGPRWNAQLNYDAQALWFADNSDANDIYHDALGRANLEVAPESLFLDGYLRYDQQNIDPANRVANSNLFNTDNRTDVLVYALTPYHVGRWGGWGESLVQLQHQGVRYINTPASRVLDDSDTNSVSASLGSPRDRRGVSWKGSGSIQRTSYDAAPDFAYDRVALDLGMPVGLRTRLTGTVGQESDVVTDRTEGGLDETFWYVGVEWQPSELQSFALRVGDRFYGTAYEGSWRRRGSRGELSVEYSEEPTTASGVLGDESVFDSGFSPGGVPSLDSRVFLRKRLAGRMSYELSRSTIAGRIYAERREYLDVGEEDEKNHGAALSYDWAFAARTRLRAGIDWEQRERDASRTDTFGELSAEIARELTPTLSGLVRVAHFYRDSDAAFDYSANEISVSVVKQF